MGFKLMPRNSPSLDLCFQLAIAVAARITPHRAHRSCAETNLTLILETCHGGGSRRAGEWNLEGGRCG